MYYLFSRFTLLCGYRMRCAVQEYIADVQGFKIIEVQKKITVKHENLQLKFPQSTFRNDPGFTRKSCKVLPFSQKIGFILSDNGETVISLCPNKYPMFPIKVSICLQMEKLFSKGKTSMKVSLCRSELRWE